MGSTKCLLWLSRTLNCDSYSSNHGLTDSTATPFLNCSLISSLAVSTEEEAGRAAQSEWKICASNELCENNPKTSCCKWQHCLLGVCCLLNVVWTPVAVAVLRLPCQEKTSLRSIRKEPFWQSQAALWQMETNTTSLQGWFSRTQELCGWTHPIPLHQKVCILAAQAKALVSSSGSTAVALQQKSGRALFHELAQPSPAHPTTGAVLRTSPLYHAFWTAWWRLQSRRGSSSSVLLWNTWRVRINSVLIWDATKHISEKELQLCQWAYCQKLPAFLTMRWPAWPSPTEQRFWHT